MPPRWPTSRCAMGGAQGRFQATMILGISFSPRVSKPQPRVASDGIKIKTRWCILKAELPEFPCLGKSIRSGPSASALHFAPHPSHSIPPWSAASPRVHCRHHLAFVNAAFYALSEWGTKASICPTNLGFCQKGHQIRYPRPTNEAYDVARAAASHPSPVLGAAPLVCLALIF